MQRNQNSEDKECICSEDKWLKTIEIAVLLKQVCFFFLMFGFLFCYHVLFSLWNELHCPACYVLLAFWDNTHKCVSVTSAYFKDQCKKVVGYHQSVITVYFPYSIEELLQNWIFSCIHYCCFSHIHGHLKYLQHSFRVYILICVHEHSFNCKFKEQQYHISFMKSLKTINK